MSSILVVDDDRDSRMLVEFKLASLGHDIRVETDGERGLAAARAEIPDLMIVDWMMPRLTGIEVCREVRADPVLARLPLILITGRAQEVDLQRGLASGADDYILKPYSLRELASRVEAHLDRSRRGTSRAG